MNRILLLWATLLAAHTHGYKILCIFGVPSPSHDILGKGIVDSLLSAGHEVTWATPFPEKYKPGPNLDIIDVSITKTIMERRARELAKRPHDLDFTRLAFAQNISDATVSAKALREVVVHKQFDAVVTERFFTDVDAGYAAVQQAPWIVLSGIVMHPQLEGLVDEVRSLTTVPTSMPATLPMRFWQRVRNVASYGLIWFDMMMRESAYASRYEHHFGPLAAARGITLPPYREAASNVSILLVNSHPSISTPQVLPPNVVEIAGYHISEKTAPLPKDLQDILDSSHHGVIYFSMGSVLQADFLPEHTRKSLIQVFRELPYTVLWKFDEKICATKPGRFPSP